MRGRKHIPPELKVITGEKRKKRLAPDRPTPEPCIPEPPDILDGDALEEWIRITPDLDRLGILTGIDRASLAGYCQSYGDWLGAVRKVKKTGTVIKTDKGSIVLSPYVRAAAAALAAMKGFAIEFGLTPSSRCRVKVVKKPEGEKNRWKELG